MKIYVRVHCKRLLCSNEKLDLGQYYFRLHLALSTVYLPEEYDLSAEQADYCKRFYDTEAKARRAGRKVANRIKAASIDVIVERPQYVHLKREDGRT